MKKKFKNKQLFSWLMAIFMLVSMLPMACINSFAEETESHATTLKVGDEITLGSKNIVWVVASITQDSNSSITEATLITKKNLPDKVYQDGQSTHFFQVTNNHSSVPSGNIDYGWSSISSSSTPKKNTAKKSSTANSTTNSTTTTKKSNAYQLLNASKMHDNILGSAKNIAIVQNKTFTDRYGEVNKEVNKHASSNLSTYTTNDSIVYLPSSSQIFGPSFNTTQFESGTVTGSANTGPQLEYFKNMKNAAIKQNILDAGSEDSWLIDRNYKNSHFKMTGKHDKMLDTAQAGTALAFRPLVTMDAEKLVSYLLQNADKKTGITVKAMKGQVTTSGEPNSNLTTDMSVTIDWKDMIFILNSNIDYSKDANNPTITYSWEPLNPDSGNINVKNNASKADLEVQCNFEKNAKINSNSHLDMNLTKQDDSTVIKQSDNQHIEPTNTLKLNLTPISDQNNSVENIINENDLNNLELPVLNEGKNNTKDAVDIGTITFTFLPWTSKIN